MLRRAPALLLLSAALGAAAPHSARRTALAVCDDVQDPATLDPQKEFSEKNHTVVQQIYEGLVRFAPDGRIEPALAVSWERRDPLRMRFHLRPGVRFHDGEPFDAEAVRFSILRYLDPKTGFPALGYISSLERVETVDRLTVDIITKFSDGLLLKRLAGFIMIVPPEYLRRKGDAALSEAPVGTGAFRFVRWDHGAGITLERNPDYWMAGYPKIDELDFRFIETKAQLDALKSGAIDVLTELPGTQTTEALRAGGIRVIKQPSLYTVTGSFNTGRAPLSDVTVRRALNYAVNRSDLIRYDLLGNGHVLATVTMPEEEGHDATLKPFPYDPRKALRMLEEASYGNGFTLKVAVKVQGERAARIIAKQLSRVGVTLDIHVFSDAELIPALAREPWDMFLAGCPDPMAHAFFIQSIFLYSLSPYHVVENKAYDARVNDMVATLDDGRRRRLAEELDRHIQDQALLLFLYQRVKTYGVREGTTFAPSLTGMPYFFGATKGGS